MEDRSKKMITVPVAKFCQKQKLHKNNMNETDQGTDKPHHFSVHLTSQCGMQVKQQNWPFAKLRVLNSIIYPLERKQLYL